MNSMGQAAGTFQTAGTLGQMVKGPGIHQRTRDAADRTSALLQRLVILRERLTGAEPEAAGTRDAPRPPHLECAVSDLQGGLAGCDAELSRIEQAL